MLAAVVAAIVPVLLNGDVFVEVPAQESFAVAEFRLMVPADEIVFAPPALFANVNVVFDPDRVIAEDPIIDIVGESRVI